MSDTLEAALRDALVGVERRDERIAELERERDDAFTKANNAMTRAEKAERELVEARDHLIEIIRRFRTVAIDTADDRDYDLTYVAGAIQDARRSLAGEGGGDE